MLCNAQILWPQALEERQVLDKAQPSDHLTPKLAEPKGITNIQDSAAPSKSQPSAVDPSPNLTNGLTNGLATANGSRMVLTAQCNGGVAAVEILESQLRTMKERYDQTRSELRDTRKKWASTMSNTQQRSQTYAALYSS